MLIFFISLIVSLMLILFATPIGKIVMVIFCIAFYIDITGAIYKPKKHHGRRRRNRF